MYKKCYVGNKYRKDYLMYGKCMYGNQMGHKHVPYENKACRRNESYTCRGLNGEKLKPTSKWYIIEIDPK